MERETFRHEQSLWAIERTEHKAFIHQWQTERKQHQNELKSWEDEKNNQRKQWEDEKADHEEENRRWEKERWERMRLYWGDLRRGEHCHSYAIREYTSRLWNIDPTVDPIEACMRTSVTINGKIFSSPIACEDRGRDGIHGRWLVDVGESACEPNWGTLDDKGCVPEGSGFHRLESRLWNIADGDTWMTMCTTTPNNIHGVRKVPTSCEEHVSWSIWGVWEYVDPNC
ncbi:hypothetical protein BDW22DRAFT_1321910 [Trametopsis cervina]|nr:hypothetical protein BDW22DRAFT_1321910 [Trametopsis cervina]